MWGSQRASPKCLRVVLCVFTVILSSHALKWEHTLPQVWPQCRPIAQARPQSKIGRSSNQPHKGPPALGGLRKAEDQGVPARRHQDVKERPSRADHIPKFNVNGIVTTTSNPNSTQELTVT